MILFGSLLLVAVLLATALFIRWQQRHSVALLHLEQRGQQQSELLAQIDRVMDDNSLSEAEQLAHGEALLTKLRESR